MISIARARGRQRNRYTTLQNARLANNDNLNMMLPMHQKLLAFVTALQIPKLSLGWWDTGHMLTVAIARQRLSNTTIAELDRLVIASESVQAMSPVPSTTLISASHWADDVKRRDWDPSDKVMVSPSGVFLAFDAVRAILYIYAPSCCTPRCVDAVLFGLPTIVSRN